MRKMNSNYWLKGTYFHPIKWSNVDKVKSTQYAIQATNILERIIPGLLFFQYEDIISNLVILNQNEHLNIIRSLIPKKEIANFGRKINEGEISSLSIQELKGKCPKYDDYSIIRFIDRLFDEGEIDFSLSLLNSRKIRLETFIESLCNSKLSYLEISDVLFPLRQENKFSIRHFCIRIGTDLLNNKIDINSALLILEKFGPLSDLEKRHIIHWKVNSNYYDGIENICKTFSSKDEYMNIAIYLARDAASSDNLELRKLSIKLLGNFKKNKEVKLYLKLINEVCIPDLVINDVLLDLVKSNKRYQPDDEIFYYLLNQSRIEDAKLFVDMVQGVNKIHHYSALVKHYLDQPNKIEELFDDKRYGRIAEEAVKRFAKKGRIKESRFWLTKKIKDSRMRNVLWGNILKALILENNYEEINLVLKAQRSEYYKFKLNLFMSNFLLGKKVL